MPSIFKYLALTVTLATVSAAALAQTSPPPSPPPKALQASESASELESEQAFRKRRLKWAVEDYTQQMNVLKLKLKITPAQETAWGRFQVAMQPTLDFSVYDQHRDDPDNLTGPQQIDQAEQIRAPREAAMRQRGAAVKTFYTQLTPYQQGMFDAQNLRELMVRGWPRY
ncbi:Spy/CpxP family protein refolding chaperone [Ottowia sp.]|uniref:Spy/CpxP family protein refolding chaperone n=1 Tax=Ottowia sp. TaxID=1898956 RepID=UPI003A8B4F0E